MDNGSREAEQVVRLTMDGMQYMVKISGSVSQEMLKFFSALAKMNKQTSGVTRLKNLLMSGSELKVITLQGEDKFKIFAEEAKRYGVIYSVVKRSSEDKSKEIYEIMVKAEDASKINRIIEKNGLINSIITDETADEALNNLTLTSEQEKNVIEHLAQNVAKRTADNNKELNFDNWTYEDWDIVYISPKLIEGETEDEFITRVPRTSGDNAKYLNIKKNEMESIYDGKMYVTVFNKNMYYSLHDSNGQHIESLHGSELREQHYWNKNPAPAEKKAEASSERGISVEDARSIINEMMTPTKVKQREVAENVPGLQATDRENLFVADSVPYRYDGTPDKERPSVKSEIDAYVRSDEAAESVLEQGITSGLDEENRMRREMYKSQILKSAKEVDETFRRTIEEFERG